MVNTEEFVKRLEKLLRYYGLTASGFADQISVQRSSISHLLSGRNKPSLDLVLKIIKTFPEVNLYWLLNGKGSFPSDTMAPPPVPKKPVMKKQGTKDLLADSTKAIEKVIIFYTDGSFKSFDGK